MSTVKIISNSSSTRARLFGAGEVRLHGMRWHFLVEREWVAP